MFVQQSHHHPHAGEVFFGDDLAFGNSRGQHADGQGVLPVEPGPEGPGEDGAVDFLDLGLAHEKFDAREKRSLGQLNLANVFQGDGNIDAGGGMVAACDGVIPADARLVGNHSVDGFIQPAVGQDGPDPPQGGDGVDDA